MHYANGDIKYPSGHKSVHIKVSGSKTKPSLHWHEERLSFSSKIGV